MQMVGKNIIIAIVLLLLGGCKSITHTQETQKQKNDIIVFGKLTIDGLNDFDYKKLKIYLDKNPKKKNKRQQKKIVLDKNGYFFVDLPTGKHRITHFKYKKKDRKLAKENLSIDIKSTDSVYYVGNVHIKLKSLERIHKINTKAQKLEKAYHDLTDKNKISNFLLDVQHPDSIINRFKRKYPMNKKGVKNLILDIKDKL